MGEIDILEELQIINLWLASKENGYLRKLGIDKSFFFGYKDVVEWIERFISSTGKLPSAETVASEFDTFRVVTDIEPETYLVNVLREQKAYTQYRPMLVSSTELLNDGRTIEAMWKMRGDIDGVLKQYSNKMTRYDWVKDAMTRYDKYMEKHGQTGLSGLTTGIQRLDDLTGGWRADDLILLAGRTNEGKSMVGGYFAYMAWKSLQLAGIDQPVIYITTEMPELEIAYRLDTLKAHFPNRALNDGKLADAELYKEYLEELQKKDTSFLILSQESNGGNPFTPADIKLITESERPAFVVVDQLYDLSDGTSERDIRKKIVNVSNGIREVNLYTQTPMMLIAQAGREAAKEGKKDTNATPELYSIQESDNPAQKATRVLTLRLIDNNLFKMSLKKNRGGKRDEDVYMRVDLDTGIWNETTVEEAIF